LPPTQLVGGAGVGVGGTASGAFIQNESYLQPINEQPQNLIYQQSQQQQQLILPQQQQQQQQQYSPNVNNYQSNVFTTPTTSNVNTIQPLQMPAQTPTPTSPGTNGILENGKVRDP